MTLYQILSYAALFVTLPFGVKILDWLITLAKAYWQKRREAKLTGTADAQELEKLRLLKEIDVSEVKRKDFTLIKDSLFEIAQAATSRALAAEQLNEHLRAQSEKTQEHCHSLEDRLEILEHVGAANTLIREQLEVNFRLMCDTFHVAYWEILPDGQVRGNSTFFKLTGLHVSKCHNGGWFEAVEESMREQCRTFWDAFIDTPQTRPAIKFKFKNALSGKTIETDVYCGAIMKNFTEVYKFTAQSSPILTDFSSN